MPAPTAHSRPPIPRRPHHDMLDSGVTRSRSPHAYREEMALNHGRMRQQRARRQRSPSPLRRASSKRRGGTRGRPQPPSRHPLRTASPRPANVGERTHTPTARSRRPPHPSPQTAAPHPAPSLTVTFPAGFHIGGLASPPSPAAVESMLCALASRSTTFQSLQPLHQLVPANARRRVTAFLLGHPRFLDAGLVQRIMEELCGGAIPDNNQGVTISTASGNLRISLATRITRQLANAVPTSEPDATPGPTGNGSTEPAPHTSEAPSDNTGDHAAISPSGPVGGGPTVRITTPAMEGLIPPPPQPEADGGPTTAPSNEDAAPLPSVLEPSPPPAGCSVVPAPHPEPSSNNDTSTAPAVSTEDLAPPLCIHTEAGSLVGSTESAPMTPPMDCALTPHLRGVEYVLSASSPLPVTNCISCLQPFREGETLVRLLCMHYFHKECVTRWFASPIHGHRCPSCNVNLIEMDN